MDEINLEQALELALHASLWQMQEVVALQAMNPQLQWRHLRLAVTLRRALEWQQSLTGAHGRRGEVVLCLQNEHNQLLLHSKSFYPSGASRLPTGGIHQSEPVLQALHREAMEETGALLTNPRPLAILFYTLQAAELAVPFISYLFHCRVSSFLPQPQDLQERISGFSWVDRAGLEETIGFLLHLPADWLDWGLFRAAPHQLLLEILAAQE